MSVQVVRVTSARDLRRFVDLPWRIHDRQAHPQWVPPLRVAVRDALDRRGNPFYRRAERELFLCLRNGRAVGRIAAILNPAHNDFHGDRAGFFGFFECVDDPDVATALFGAARSWLAARGMDRVLGPVNPSTNHDCGLLVDGFEHHPTFMTPWNPPYYAEMLAGAGFAPERDLLGYHMSVADGFAVPERFERLARRAMDRGSIAFRSLDLGRFREEIDTCWDIYNSAWEKNWGFVPFSREEFNHMAKDLKHLLHPDFAFIAEVDGEPAGFMLILLDYNHILKKIGNGRLFPFGIIRLLLGKKKLRSGRVMALGVKEQYRTRSIFPLFAWEAYRRGLELGVLEGEASWILEDNEAMNKPMRAMGARLYRRWRIFGSEAVKP
ncbi:MAG: N-acetyltransferase [Gemmatimonadota bacterium]